MTKAPDEFDKLAYRFWSIHPKDIPEATGMPDNYPGGKRAWFYANQMRDHAQNQRRDVGASAQHETQQPVTSGSGTRRCGKQRR